MPFKSRYFRSVSFIALSAAIGFVGAANIMAGSAKAENVINYEGDNAALETDPIGNYPVYRSLFSTTSLSNNTINVGGETDKGEQATWTTEDGGSAPFVIYGGVDIFERGKTSAHALTDNIENNHIVMKNVSYNWLEKNADDGTFNVGLGGFGGGSVFGGLSLGNAKNLTTSENYIDGFVGRIISDNTVFMTNVTITGSDGGYGLISSVSPATRPGSSIGGMGGASVFGGLSIGVDQLNITDYDRGGIGGEVFNNSVKLAKVTLNGGDGGNGGVGSNFSDATDGGGLGGFGGGSVFGGVSIGGTGTITSSGDGGAVHDNSVDLRDVILNGGKGGNGASTQFADGTGNGGVGGGSVFGGLSISSANGFGTNKGGKGGKVSKNSVYLYNATLNGNEGGKAGPKERNGGAGVDGLGGGSVYGGASLAGASGDGDGRPSKAGDGGDVTENTIELSGKTSISGNVYGGFSQGGGAGKYAETGLSGNVTGNTITLRGNDITIGKRNASGQVTAYGAIYGGYSLKGDGTVNAVADVFTGNRLNLDGYRGTVSGIYNIENYHWILPKDIKNGDSLITIAEGGKAVDLTNTKHTIADMDPSGARLHTGDKVTMISKTQGTWQAASPYTIKQGQFIVYRGKLAQQAVGNDTALVLTVRSNADNGRFDDDNAAGLNPQSKAYAEGRATALGFVGQAGDLVSSNIGIISSDVASNHSISSPAFTPFIITGGASQRYKTGSHVDIDGFNMLAGLAAGFDLTAGHVVTAGAFFEYGRGTYDTYNSFTNFSSVHGDGDSDYKGGGIFGRIDFAGTGLNNGKNVDNRQPDGLYADASLRVGQSSSKFDVGRNLDVLGHAGDYRGSYDSDVTYYGGHVGGGYVFNFDERNALDVYGRYLWTHMDSDTVNVGNERLQIDSSTSSRIQLGGRYHYGYNEWLKPYVGAAYDYEFDGEVAAKAYEFNLDKPSLEGSTGIFEAGIKLNPIKTNQALSVNVDGQGYVGVRQGGGGGVKLKYQF